MKINHTDDERVAYFMAYTVILCLIFSAAHFHAMVNAHGNYKWGKGNH